MKQCEVFPLLFKNCYLKSGSGVTASLMMESGGGREGAYNRGFMIKLTILPTSCGEPGLQVVQVIQKMIGENGSEETGSSEISRNFTSWGRDQDTKVLGVVWLLGKSIKHRVMLCQDRFFF